MSDDRGNRIGWLTVSGPDAYLHRGRDDAIAQAVKTCIEFGFHGTNKPPGGHWLNEMWDFGAALANKEQR